MTPRSPTVAGIRAATPGASLAYFDHDGVRLHYLDQGAGPPIVLVHGLLWSSRMFVRLRRALPEMRIILLNVRGHGQSDRPTDPEAYSWSSFAGDVIALLDHLGLDQAIVGGISLGANIAMEVGMTAPERCAGLMIEMPVLSRGRLPAKVAFTALAMMLEASRRPLGWLSPRVQRIPVPAAIPELAALRDVLGAEPVAGAALLRGLLAADALPDDDPVRMARLTMPALVIGHHKDVLHVLGDSRDLAALLPQGRLVEASSILQFRFDAATLARHVRALVRDAWPDDVTASAGAPEIP